MTIELEARRPRLWPTFAVLAALFVAQIVVSGLAALVGVLILTGGELPSGSEAFMDRVGELVTKPWGIALLLVPVQLLLVAAACVPTAIGSRDPRRRLGLVRWRVSNLTVLWLLLATPCVLLVATLLSLPFEGRESEQLELLAALLTQPRGYALALMLALVTFGAAFSEELFFRGFVQTRLAERWGALPAIAVTALCFAALHLDPVHALAVLPLGLWAGFLARVTGSVFPAMAAHALNNGIAALIAGASGDAASDPEALAPAALGVLGMLGLALFSGVLGLRRLRRELAAAR